MAPSYRLSFCLQRPYIHNTFTHKGSTNVDTKHPPQSAPGATKVILFCALFALVYSGIQNGAMPLKDAVSRGNGLAVWQQLNVQRRNVRTNKALLTPAIRYNYSFIAEQLIRHGLSPHSMIKDGVYLESPALSYSVMRNAPETFYMLLQYVDKKRLNDKEPTYKRTALHWAASKGSVSFVKALLRRGADPRAKDKYGDTPLHIACNTKKVSSTLIEALLAAGASPNTRNNRKETPMFTAASNNHTEALETLHRRGGKLHLKNKWGESLLHVAATDGSTDAVTWLIQKGLPVDIKDTKHHTPLFALLSPSATAKNKNRLAVLKLLISKGANPNAIDLEGKTPLLEATVLSDNQDIAIALIKHGASLDVTNNLNQTVLHRAAQRGSFKLAKAIVEKRPDKKYLRRRSALGETALHEAADNFKEGDKITALLLSKGVTPNVANKFGATPLHKVATAKIARLLLQAKANVNAKTVDGRTPLHDAIRYGRLPVVRELIKYKADTNALYKGMNALALAKKEGKMAIYLFLSKQTGRHPQPIVNKVQEKTIDTTPMFQAIKSNQLKEVTRLLDGGFPLAAKNKDGATALHIASQFGRKQIVMLLKMRGASLTALDKYKYTPLHSTFSLGQKDVALYLLQQGADPFAITSFRQDALTMAVKECLVDVVEWITTHKNMPRPQKKQKSPLVQLTKELPQIQHMADTSTCTVTKQRAMMKALLNAYKQAKLPLPKKALFNAARYSPLPVFQMLYPHYKRGIRQADNHSHLLHWAASHITGKTDNLRWLHENQKLSLEVFDKKGLLPIHYTVANAYVAILAYLLNKGRSLHRTDNHGNTPLLTLCRFRPWEGFTSTLKLLLSKGASLKQVNKDGQHCVHLIVSMAGSRQAKTVQAILRHTKHLLNTQDKKGQTPLHVAAISHSQAPIRLLLEAGANPWYRDNRGRTPYDLVKDGSSTSLKALLQNAMKKHKAPASRPTKTSRPSTQPTK
ncbi:MAG TPA: hypothetical protein DCE42_30435 [Myxococcales bacterium]|nr:hypothetical protein [Deltaproteobacteria bacterium]HAA59112.1 hypothetical protein [Myxococcales bacterium]